MTPLKALLLIAVFVVLAVWAGHWLMQRVRGDRVVPTPEESARIEAERRQPQVVATAQRPPPTVPITLRLGWTALWPTLSWFIGWWFGALCLWGEPTLLWTRWLGWPAAVLLTLFGIAEGVTLWGLLQQRLVVSPEGVALWHGAQLQRELRWHEVRAVRQVDQLRRYATDMNSSAKTTRVDRQWLHFLDAEGQPQIAIGAPLRPAADYQALLDAVPTWTGQPLTREIRGP